MQTTESQLELTQGWQNQSFMRALEW